jgi:hypothetical protein
MSLGSTHPLTEMNARKLLVGGKGRPASKADLTAICESIVYKMWEPRRLTALWAFTACYLLPFIECYSIMIGLWIGGAPHYKYVHLAYKLAEINLVNEGTNRN